MTKISRQLEEICNITIQWVVQKLNSGDGLSCLLCVIDGIDRKASIYIQESAEDAFRLARADLTSCYQDVSAYVIAYDGGWLDDSGAEHRAVIAEIEEKVSAAPRRLAFPLLVRQGQPLTFTNEVFELDPPDWSLFAAPR